MNGVLRNDVKMVAAVMDKPAVVNSETSFKTGKIMKYAWNEMIINISSTLEKGTTCNFFDNN